MSKLLEIEQFSLHFPGRGPLLNEVSLHVDDGEAVALVGESGSGKSLTTRAALGLFPGDLQALRVREGTGPGHDECHRRPSCCNCAATMRP